MFKMPQLKSLQWIVLIIDFASNISGSNKRRSMWNMDAYKALSREHHLLKYTIYAILLPIDKWG